MRHRRLPLFAAALLAGACSSNHDEEGGQVFAVVDGTEITAPMLDVLLSRLPAGADARDATTQKAALDQLVTETLLAKQARDEKFDRTPAVRRATEAAERAVLAQSFLERGLSTAAPTDTEVVGYFSDHPHLFADRRRYDLDVIQLRGSASDVRPYVASLGQGGATVAGLGERMTRDGVAMTIDRDRRTSDQLPDVVARRLATAGPGTVLTYREGDVQKFVQVVASEASPVPLAIARPMIAQFLQQQRRQTQMVAMLKRVRQDAAVEYRGIGKAIHAGRSTPATPTAAASRTTPPATT